MDRRDELLALLELLYAAPGTADAWRPFLSRLAVALNGSGASFIVHDLDGQQGNVAVTVRTDPEAVRKYQSHWWQQDPWAHRMRSRSLTVGNVVSGDQIIDGSELRKTEFYNDFGRRYEVCHSLAGVIEAARGRLAVLSVNGTDTRAPFGQDEVSLVEALMPHLQRALQLHRRLIGAEWSQTALDHVSHGVLLIDALGRVTFANRAARDIIAQRDGLAIDGAEPRAADVRGNTALRVALSSAIEAEAGQGLGSGGVVALERPSGRRPLQVVVAPLVMGGAIAGLDLASAVVFVTDPDRAPVPSTDHLRAQFGLTPAEARFAVHLLGGKSLEQTAEQLGITRNTARTHLRQLFAKTDTSRQAELMRLLLTLGISSPPEGS